MVRLLTRRWLLQIYCASKKIAEEEAWKIAKEPETKWDLCTVVRSHFLPPSSSDARLTGSHHLQCPPMVLGPISQPIGALDAINTSAGAVWAVVDAKEVPETTFPVWVDVRDIANIHVKGVTEEISKGKRYASLLPSKRSYELTSCANSYLCIAGHYDNTQIASIARKAFPDQASRIPDAKPSEGSPHFKTDSSLVEKELGIKWIGFEQCIKDTLSSIFEVEKELKGSK